MNSQLLTDVTGSTFVHFSAKAEIEGITAELAARNVAVLVVDGTGVHSKEDLFRSFALALKMPTGWYGDEEYAPNADAFLEYLDDVAEWVPAKGHVVVISGAEHLWREQPRLAGLLVEWWQFATGPRGAKIHLVFAW